ncbi:MAG: hypothetical protein IKN63_02590 [Bacilli bacterium]|nr:hypothetical protein [Bacilli bacterium]
MKKINWKKDLKKHLLIAVLLFGLTVLFFVPPTYAIFRELADSDGELVSAEWAVTLEQTGISNNVTVVPGISTGTFTLNVKSLSKVDVVYDIVITDLPAEVDVSIDGVNYPTVSNGSVTFTNAGTILASSQNKINSHTLTFRGTNGSLYENNSLINQVVNVVVNAKQTLS